MPLLLGNTRGWEYFYGGIYTVMSMKEKSKKFFLENGGNPWFLLGFKTLLQFFLLCIRIRKIEKMILGK